ncbi:transglutaminase domain-containing protein [uncultured Kordia sp.]|uniref:transglutaminase domain-containing protein n=1 Tax=uncultured Kordia sp. TaxID=507699 RepID=UPI00260B9373|nr:transglutaminase domain-containing protein [uncultured Kordia sp.]
MKTYCIIFLFFVCNYFASAQDYTSVDKVVATYPSTFQSVEEFAKRIEKDFTTDADKVRAAYYWISNTITYNHKGLRTGRDPYPKIVIRDAVSQEDFEYKYNKRYAAYVLQYKTAVCEGYSQLLFFTCEYMNIKAKVIEGNAMTDLRDIGKIPHDTDHAWNAVFFNEKWNLIDATWSTGNEEENPNAFDFTDSYFCIAPEKLILSHFPKNPKWQLLKEPKSKKEFYNQPIIYEEFLRANAMLAPKMKGTIRAKINDSITLRFQQIDTTKSYFYAFSKDQYSTKVKIEKDKGGFILKIPFKGTKRDQLEIFRNTKGILAFRIIPTR